MRCLDYFTLMPVLPEVHFCPVGIVILCSKDIFSYNSMLIYFRCNTAIEGKLASNVKWAMQVASEKGAPSWLATLPIAKHGFALHKGAFRDAPFLTIWLATFPSTISLHLWPTLHSWACTNQHSWWIPFNSPQWPEGHDGCVPHWSVTRRNWATTSTTHRWTSYTWSSKQEGWGPSRHFSWQLLGKRPEPRICWHRDVQPLRAESLKYFPQSVLQEKQAGSERSVWSTCQRSGAWSFSTLGGRGPTVNMVYKEYPQWLPRSMTGRIARFSIASAANWTIHSWTYVPKRSKIQHSPPSNIPRHNGPTRHEGWVPLHWTEPTYIKIK